MKAVHYKRTVHAMTSLCMRLCSKTVTIVPQLRKLLKFEADWGGGGGGGRDINRSNDFNLNKEI